jgi:hypothetical protein
MKEDEIIGPKGIVFPDSKNPYLYLKKRDGDNNVTSAPRIEHMRRRIIFSTVDEFDSNVSEANRIKKIEYRDN